MNEFKENTKGFSLKEVILIIFISSLVTSLTTGMILYNQNRLTKNITYQDLSQDESLKEFLNVYASLIDEYYEDVDKKGMLESAINAMFNYLNEDYSTYMSKEETDALAQKLLGEYKGIGIEIDSHNTIANFIENSPAKEAGLQVNDRIIAVNGNFFPTDEEDHRKLLTDAISNTSIGETVTLTISRGIENLNYTVEVKNLYLSSISYEMKENQVGYIKIDTFSNTLKEQMQNALNTLESQGMQSLILDLRDNTGGYLSSAKEVASLFLEKGKTIYYLEEKDKTEEFQDETEEHKTYKVILLQNKESASASEVLLAALKEYGAVSVGTTSYGKGKVQQTYSLEDGSMVKYTSAKWLTPKKECIDGIGLIPDYVIEQDNTNPNEDLQLEKALELAKEI